MRIDLTNLRVHEEEQSDSFYRRYFGGRALIAHYLLRELEPKTDPLSPDNLLVFATGVLTGHPFSGSGRNSVGAKSPLTDAYGDAEVGGFWGAELKKAGYDAIILRGRAQKCTYLYVNDGSVEFKDAQAFLGKPTGEVEEAIKRDLGEPRVRVSQIGPAGERKVRFANITNDLSHFAGRTGMGAVMGSKNLRAIAVVGDSTPQMADPEKVHEIARWLSEHPEAAMPNGGVVSTAREHGTGVFLLSLNEAGGLPTRNFQESTFEDADKISGETMTQTILTGRHTCYACIINCKRTVEVEDPYRVDPRYGGPEYETLASLGSNCGVSDLKAIAKANEICAANGIDTISTGVAISFAMECYENGVLAKKDTDGLELRFGDAEAMLEMTRQIAERRGLGRLLGEGVRTASEKIGKGSDKYALHIKGLEVPMHEPRFKKALGVGYAVSPTGADHCHNFHDGLLKGTGTQLDKAKALGILEPQPSNMLNAEKMRMLMYMSNWRHFTNCAVVCYFVPHFYHDMPQLVEAVTGWNMTAWELLKVGERAVTLTRAFNVREGFTPHDDILPRRFSQPVTKGPIAGDTVQPEELDRMKYLYYEMMGWDKRAGVPSEGKLYELDVGWVNGLIRQSSAN